MSRCFPYPPPGDERKIRDVGLIESIKLQKEREKARKEKKTEKKEKKNEQKEKREKSRENGKIEEKKYGSEKRHKNERRQVYQEEGKHTKGRVEEIEQLERSSLTEEHGQPTACLSLYDSSDSTQYSGKRKSHDTAADSGHNHGNKIRIRLKKPRHSEPDHASTEQQLGFSVLLKSKDPAVGSNKQICLLRSKDPVVRSNRPKNVELRRKEQPCSSGLLNQNFPECRSNDKQACSSHGTAILPEVPETSFKICRPESAAQKWESRFSDLFVNWNPPPLQPEAQDFDSQDWLCGAKQPCKQEIRQTSVVDSSYDITAGQGPRALYLPEGDIFALPFVLPY